jgi:hypothetical protein
MTKGLEDTLRGADLLGKIDTRWFERLPTVFIVFIGVYVPMLAEEFE